jgi:hypothetical protein
VHVTINRWSAYIHSNKWRVNGFKLFFFARQGIENNKILWHGCKNNQINYLGISYFEDWRQSFALTPDFDYFCLETDSKQFSEGAKWSPLFMHHNEA